MIFDMVRKYGVTDKNSALTIIAADGYGEPLAVQAAYDWLAASKSLWTVPIAAVALPLIIWAIVRVVRWIRAGFKETPETSA